MIYLNRIEVVGNLTRDPELRSTPSQQSVASFAVATNRRYRDTSGNWVDAPAEYHEIVVWGALGERCHQVLHKGDRIYLTGRIQTRSWEGPDGNKRYKTEVIADTIVGPDLINKGLGGSSNSDNGAYSSNDFGSSAGGSSTSKAAAPVEEEINIEDIPF